MCALSRVYTSRPTCRPALQYVLQAKQRSFQRSNYQSDNKKQNYFQGVSLQYLSLKRRRKIFKKWKLSLTCFEHETFKRRDNFPCPSLPHYRPYLGLSRLYKLKVKELRSSTYQLDLGLYRYSGSWYEGVISVTVGLAVSQSIINKSMHQSIGQSKHILWSGRLRF